ncbi:MAG: hypothetical protein HY847_03530 [Betaproteobacteria bacterium]|nr:hypothetical protein [Betaproteobacteria bacterium]
MIKRTERKWHWFQIDTTEPGAIHSDLTEVGGQLRDYMDVCCAIIKMRNGDDSRDFNLEQVKNVIGRMLIFCIRSSWDSDLSYV